MDHLVALPGGSWAMWRCVVLRGTGFPAQRVLRLAAPSCAAAADRLLGHERQVAALQQRAMERLDQTLDQLREQGGWDDKAQRKPLLNAIQALKKGRLPKGIEQYSSLHAACQTFRAAHGELRTLHEDFGKAYDADLDRISEEVAEVFAWDRFREAVTWQNPQAVHNLSGTFRKRRGKKKRNAQRRRHEEVVATYLQRYCVKNDTIGFFGPVGWATVVDGGEPLRVRPGAELLEGRDVYFETWAIDTLAQKLARQPALRPWLAPRLRSNLHLAGETLYVPFKPALELCPDEARLLAACNGRRSARVLATELVADPRLSLTTEEEVFALLEDLVEKRIVVWDLEVPMGSRPERSLAGHLERIEKKELGEACSSALRELDAARQRVARAAGDAPALRAAMSELERTFSRLTGEPASRRHGQTYAARGLIYEDCRRATEVDIGPEVIRRLGPPLTLVLQSARWMAGELTRRVEARMREHFVALRQRCGSDTVESYALLSQVLSSLFLKRERDPLFVEVEEAFRHRWLQVLDLDPEDSSHRVDFTARDLAGRVEEVFAPTGRAWGLARYLSPDVMIAADGEDELQQGKFQIILGELHAGNCMSWSCFISQHPDPEAICSFVEADMDHAFDLAGRPFVLPQLPSRSQTQRMAISLLLPRFHRFKFGDEPPDDTACEVLPAGEVVIFESDEGLMARTRDGRLRFPAIDLLGAHLTPECSTILGSLLEPAAHWPRITVDGVVIARERWRFDATDLDFAALSDPKERLLAVRRWAERYGLPRFCFYKFFHEVKPCYLDLDSPIYIDIFVKMLRAAGEESIDFWVSEMLPRVAQTWLQDAEGQRYTCELRTVTFDLASP